MSGVEDAAGDGLDQATEAAGIQDVSGTMPLQWRTADGRHGPVRFIFSQDGLSVDGSVVFEDHPCLQELSVDAHVEIDGLHGALVAGDARLPFELTLFDSHGPKSPSGVIDGAKNVACLAKDGSLQLSSL